MHELVVVFGTTVVVAGAIALAAAWVEPFLRVAENFLTYVSTGIIIFVMVVVCADVLMRYGFNHPIQGQLEGSELLMPMIVFFAISYTQARNGHVGMSLVVDALPPRGGRALEVATHVFSAFICAVLAYFGAKYAYQLFRYDDVTMTPPYWRTWPSAASISLGYLMLAVRMWLQALHLLLPDRFPGPPPEETSGLHAE